MPSTRGSREQIDEEVKIDDLCRQMGRYNLVVAVSRRARDLKERVDSVLVPSTGSLTKRALREIAEGKVKVIPSVEEKAPEAPKKLGRGARKK